MNEENAACVNKASEALDHISTAMVLKPVGLNNSVCGNSFIVDKNTTVSYTHLTLPTNREV